MTKQDGVEEEAVDTNREAEDAGTTRNIGLHTCQRPRLSDMLGKWQLFFQFGQTISRIYRSAGHRVAGCTRPLYDGGAATYDRFWDQSHCPDGLHVA